MSDTYHGWTNRETWLANLWLTNEPDTESLLTETVARCDANGWDAESVTEHTFREHLGIDEASGLASDLLNTAWNQIDWTQIVEAVRETVA